MTERRPFRLLEATVDAVREEMDSGDLTCRQLVEMYLARIEAYDRQGPSLTAIQTVNPDAFAEADRLDAQLRTSGPIGPLHGIPVLVKDQVETSNMLTTYGSVLFRDFIPARDATVVTKLKAAGALILAKTTMGEFAAGYAGTNFGVCRNAYDPTRDASGSSSGSGAGTAANFAMLAVGEDTLGSIRGPAARGSIVGLRPTVPLVSRFGMMPANPTRDTLGPMARTVRDTAILLDVLAGYDPNDPVTAACVGHIPATYTSFLTPDSLKGRRLGVIRQVMATDTDPDSDDYRQIRSVLDQALHALATAGAEIVDPLPIADVRELLEQTGGNFEAEEVINLYLAAHPNAPVKTFQELVLSDQVLPWRRTRLIEAVGRTRNDLGFLHHLQVREQLRLNVLTAMADHGLDALIYPSFDHSPGVIPEDFMTTKNLSQRGSNRSLAPMLAFPAITVPAGYTPDGLPVGIEFLGRPFSEGLLLAIAYGYEQATLHRRPPGTTPSLPGEP